MIAFDLTSQLIVAVPVVFEARLKISFGFCVVQLKAASLQEILKSFVDFRRANRDLRVVKKLLRVELCEVLNAILRKEHAEIVNLNVELLDAVEIFFVVYDDSVDGESFFRVFVKGSVKNCDLTVDSRRQLNLNVSFGFSVLDVI